MKTTSPREAAIRDYLFANLSVITPGLMALDKEVHLPNPDGASGFIDILAKDAQGCRVVVELKRCASSSRTALHEIEKYVELLKRAHGIPERDLRVIILSTDWRELLTPFSSYARKVDYPVEGFAIVVGRAGDVVSTCRVTPLTEASELRFSEFHLSFCFADKSRREDAKDTLKAIIAANGVTDYCLFSLENLKRDHIIFPYCLYLAPAWQEQDSASFPSLFTPPIPESEFWEGFSEDEQDAVEFGNARWLDFLSARAFSACAPDETNFSSPRSASPLLINGWKFTCVERSGRWKGTEKLRSDAELWMDVCGYGTTNPMLFFDRSFIGHTARWSSLRARAGAFLAAAPDWNGPIVLYFDELEKTFANAKVSVMMCLQDDVLIPIERYVRTSDPRSFSQIELHCDSRPCRRVIGMLEWQQKRPLQCVEDALDGAFDSFEDYVFSRGGLHFYALPMMLKNLGLKLSIFEWLPETDDCYRLSAHDGKLIREKIRKNSLEDIEVFVAAQPKFVQDIVTRLRDSICGLDLQH